MKLIIALTDYLTRVNNAINLPIKRALIDQFQCEVRKYQYENDLMDNEEVDAYITRISIIGDLSDAESFTIYSINVLSKLNDDCIVEMLSHVFNL